MLTLGSLTLGRCILLLAFCAVCNAFSTPGNPGAPNCTERWFNQTLDHLSWRTPPRNQFFWQQRYLVYDKYWQRQSNGEMGPIFLYTGNEAAVELYANYTGLMWENAPKFGALLLFVEHRYYGKSLPFGANSLSVDPSYLTIEQVLADYSTLVTYVKNTMGGVKSPVVTFGGSYGGMLAAYMRIRYPFLVAGAIAASAPVGAFPDNVTNPGFNPQKYWQVVTRAASPAGGSPAGCTDNVRRGFKLIASLGTSSAGFARLSQAFRLCTTLTPADLYAFSIWVMEGFDILSVINWPYPASYVGGSPSRPLPEWPLRQACGNLAGNITDDDALLQGMSKAIATFFNATGASQCFQWVPGGLSGQPAGRIYAYTYQMCTEGVPESTFFPTNGVTDMFFNQGVWDADWLARINQQCQTLYGVMKRPGFIPSQFGGLEVSGATNIVFSNGDIDPWSSGGILEDVSDTVIALVIPQAAHHIDLNFAHPADFPALTLAREVEVQHMTRWVDQAYAARLRKVNGTTSLVLNGTLGGVVNATNAGAGVAP